MANNLVYLVTGGSGFIGEHIVTFLHKEEYVKEVKIFDVNEGEFIKDLRGGSTTITFIKGEITDYNQVLKAFKNVHVVIHAAALVDFLDEHPLKEKEAINVGGTENVIKACLASAVPFLLYTSSIAAVGPNTNLDPMEGVTEETIYHGELLLTYGKTKAKAEKLVHLANGKQMSNGKKLTTCFIRPSGVYGEKSQILLNAYQSAKSQNNRINYIQMENTRQGYEYVGNVAWMHVLAARQMQMNPHVLGGQAYYAYDDTPVKHIKDLHQELFTEFDPDIQIGSHIPYWKIWLLISIHSLIRFVLKPFWKLKPFLTLPILKLVSVTFYYDTDKAFRHFGYKPFYSWVESKQKISQWLKLETEDLRKTKKNN
ncbi:PREDICTED: 3 beta-hydroxysteroid dehydrogenase type 7-like [Nanorana parkeri]|uniref:3 beta-hydroxysteroid dehydrogenase type 7-like n=1 Tax=Nanorana parkeri TaxID=125878 RepID=UPI000854B378|nr:PREDICTED: 3 beta-hydroxysteroid dehydrogenase type 7-like [Nanorana parkeri]